MDLEYKIIRMKEETGYKLVKILDNKGINDLSFSIWKWLKNNSRQPCGKISSIFIA